jgi:hypothetical protein
MRIIGGHYLLMEYFFGAEGLYAVELYDIEELLKTDSLPGSLYGKFCNNYTYEPEANKLHVNEYSQHGDLFFGRIVNLSTGILSVEVPDWVITAAMKQFGKNVKVTALDENRVEIFTTGDLAMSLGIFSLDHIKKNILHIVGTGGGGIIKPIALDEILKLIPHKWLDSWLTPEEFAKALTEAKCEKTPALLDDKSVLIFSEGATFGERTDGEIKEGIGILLPNFVKSNVKVAVVAATDRQKGLIVELNKGISEDKRIVCAGNVAEAMSMISARRYCYFKVASEADSDMKGINNVTIIVEKIIDAIGSVMNITRPELIQHMHDAARQFAQAA